MQSLEEYSAYVADVVKTITKENNISKEFAMQIVNAANQNMIADNLAHLQNNAGEIAAALYRLDCSCTELGRIASAINGVADSLSD